MHVLVTNDDGIQSRGLSILADAALAAGHEVTVVAPHRQYSGASASLTAQESNGEFIFVDKRPPGLDERAHAFAVKAAPGLIGFVASFEAFGFRPDLVMSGINLGANTGRAVLHSGTVGAALAASSHGIRSLAVSIASSEPQHWETARLVTDHALRWVTDNAIGDRVLNINVPDIAPDRLRGIRPATLASFGAVQARVKDQGSGYVHLTYSAAEEQDEKGTDHYLLARGWSPWTLVRGPVADAGVFELPKVDLAEAGDVRVDVSTGMVMSTSDDRPTGELDD